MHGNNAPAFVLSAYVGTMDSLPSSKSSVYCNSLFSTCVTPLSKLIFNFQPSVVSSCAVTYSVVFHRMAFWKSRYTTFIGSSPSTICQRILANSPNTFSNPFLKQHQTRLWCYDFFKCPTNASIMYFPNGCSEFPNDWGNWPTSCNFLPTFLKNITFAIYKSTGISLVSREFWKILNKASTITAAGIFKILWLGPWHLPHLMLCSSNCFKFPSPYKLLARNNRIVQEHMNGHQGLSSLCDFFRRLASTRHSRSR